MSTTDPTHHALLSLLPSSYPPPPKLLSHAETLLSLSRQRASNLKPDEEIARAHACAEIACRRLRVQLRLPNIKSGNGAPCRPGVYGKLLSFLEKTFGDVEVDGGTPRKGKDNEVRTPTTGGRSGGIGRSTGRKRNIEALGLDGDDEGEIETPTKKRRTGDLLAMPTKARATPKKTNGFVGRIEASAGKGKKDVEAPDYVLPSTRTLCKAFKTTKMVPHVYTGVSVVLDLFGEWPRSAEAELPEEAEQHRQDVLGLVVAVFLMTLTRMQKGFLTTDVYDAVSKRSIELLEMTVEHSEAQTGIEEWIARINDSGWTTEAGKGESWWSSVPEDVIAPLKLSRSKSQGQEVNVVDVDEDDDATPRPARTSKASRTTNLESQREELRRQVEEEDPEDVLLPGLGTMMNDAVDYLSEERTAEYEIWKAEILRRIDVMEKGGGSAKKGRCRAVAATA